jgi:hypothetical protein
MPPVRDQVKNAGVLQTQGALEDLEHQNQRHEPCHLDLEVVQAAHSWSLYQESRSGLVDCPERQYHASENRDQYHQAAGQEGPFEHPRHLELPFLN